MNKLLLTAIFIKKKTAFSDGPANLLNTKELEILLIRHCCNRSGSQIISLRKSVLHLENSVLLYPANIRNCSSYTLVGNGLFDTFLLKSKEFKLDILIVWHYAYLYSTLVAVLYIIKYYLILAVRRYGI